MCGTTARQQLNVPLRLTSSTSSQASGGYSQVRTLGPAIPALLTRMSMPSNAASVASRARSTASSTVTSTAKASIRPRAFSSTAALSESLASRSQMAIAAPESRNRCAMARPIPCAPPVTTATRPERSIWFMLAPCSQVSAVHIRPPPPVPPPLWGRAIACGSLLGGGNARAACSTSPRVRGEVDLQAEPWRKRSKSGEGACPPAQGSTGMIVDILDREDCRQNWGGRFSRFAEPITRRSEAAEAARDIEQTDLTVAKTDEMVAGFELGQTNELAGERLADEDAMTSPFDLAVRVDPTNLVIFVITRLRPLRYCSIRRRIEFAGHTLAQRLMRPFLVVMVAEHIKARLLLGRIRRRRVSGLLVQGAMHPLVSAVLLWRGRMDEARFDPELEPPSRQPGETTRSTRAKGGSVVATDRPRQAISSERRRKNRLHALDRRTRDPHLDQKAAVAVHNRQRVNPLAVQRAEPAFEVGRPFIVGRRNGRKRALLVDRPAPSLDRGNQSGALENPADRRGRRPTPLRSSTLEDHQQLASPDTAVPTVQLNDLLRHLGCGRVRAMCRRMRPIHEPARFTKPMSPTPFVECVPANSVAPAQFRHAPVPRVVISHHPNALFHPTGLRKWHRRLLPPMHVDLSTILPVQSVEDLPSLYLSLWTSPLTRFASLRQGSARK